MKRLLCLMALAISSPLLAFSVSPMLGEIDLTKSHSATLKISNDREIPIRLEISIYESKQLADGKYEHSPSKDVIAFPPLLTVGGKSTQALRLLVLPANDKKVVNSYYQLVIHELPTGIPTSPSQLLKPGVNVQIEVTTALHIPLYVYPKDPTFSIALKSVHISDNSIVTQIANTGTSIARLANQQAYIRVGGVWILAGKENDKRTNALVIGHTVTQSWECPACAKKTVEAVEIRGEANHFGAFSLMLRN